MSLVKQQASSTTTAASPASGARRSKKRDGKPTRDLGPLVGRKHLRAISDYLVHLRTLYPHPNRILFYDDVVVAYLLAFFNPSIRSLRCIEDMSQVPGINRFLSVNALCRSTFSEANKLFDPVHLQGLLHHVRQQLPSQPREGSSADPDFQQILQRVTCFD